MLSRYIENLQSTIVWAQVQDDIDVLCMARDNMDQLMSFVSTLSTIEQHYAHEHIDRVLPMEWPLWMEACRYSDGEQTDYRKVRMH
jgi:hypothetical protein